MLTHPNEDVKYCRVVERMILRRKHLYRHAHHTYLFYCHYRWYQDINHGNVTQWADCGECYRIINQSTSIFYKALATVANLHLTHSDSHTTLTRTQTTHSSDAYTHTHTHRCTYTTHTTNGAVFGTFCRWSCVKLHHY